MSISIRNGHLHGIVEGGRSSDTQKTNESLFNAASSQTKVDVLQIRGAIKEVSSALRLARANLLPKTVLDLSEYAQLESVLEELSSVMGELKSIMKEIGAGTREARVEQRRNADSLRMDGDVSVDGLQVDKSEEFGIVSGFMGGAESGGQLSLSTDTGGEVKNAAKQQAQQVSETTAEVAAQGRKDTDRFAEEGSRASEKVVNAGLDTAARQQGVKAGG